MFRVRTCLTAGCGLVAALAAGPAHAQLFGRGCDCAPPLPMHAVSVSAAAINPCPVVHQVVQQQCYQAVPVTEYHPVKQTVRRPKVETRVVNQDVVEYVPVTEQRTADVPYTTYQDVTEYQQVTRNAGYWQTHIQQNIRPSPCEYDNRRTMLGWMNRSAYEFRSLFVPQQTVRRQFIPQTLVQTVPVTRRVAVPSTRQVTYNVTRMVAQRSTRQVAVNHVSYEDVVTTAMVPRTVLRHVPIGGTATALQPSGGAITLQPTPDAMQARRPQDNRSATRPTNDAFAPNSDPNRDQPIQPKKISYPKSPINDPGYHPEGDVTRSPSEDQPLVRRSPSPSMVRRNQWVARTPKSPVGPTSNISVADVDR